MAIPFSDTVNKNGLIQLAEQFSGIGDGGISGNATLLKVFTRFINLTYQTVVTMIFESQDDWQWDDIGTSDGTTPSQTTYPIATVPLVAGQRDYTFPLSLKLMHILRLDVTYDGTNWYKVEPWDSQETGLGLGNDTNTDSRFVKTQPFYDIRANAVMLYPTASASDVAAGAQLRIEFLREPVEFSSNNTANTPGIDVAFQPMIARGAAIEYCMVNAPTIAEAQQAKFNDDEQRLRRYYSRKDEDTVMALKPYYQDMT